MRACWLTSFTSSTRPDAATIEGRIVTAVLNEGRQYFDFDDDAEVQ